MEKCELSEYRDKLGRDGIIILELKIEIRSKIAY